MRGRPNAQVLAYQTPSTKNGAYKREHQNSTASEDAFGSIDVQVRPLTNNEAKKSATDINGGCAASSSP